jgi:hypothetical protein
MWEGENLENLFFYIEKKMRIGHGLGCKIPSPKIF